jgi:hypothetical protein
MEGAFNTSRELKQWLMIGSQIRLWHSPTLKSGSFLLVRIIYLFIYFIFLVLVAIIITQ